MPRPAIRRPAILPLCLAASLLVAGCPIPTFGTDEGQLTFTADDLVVGALGGFANHGAVLDGTPICASCNGVNISFGGEEPVEMSCNGDGEYDVLSCFEQGVEGGSLDGDGCVVADGPGEVHWTFQPVDCPLAGDGAQLVPDGITFAFASADDANSAIEQWLEDAAVIWYEDGYLAQPDGSGFEESLRNPAGESFRVVAEQPFLFQVGLVDASTGGALAWHGPSGSIQVVGVQGDAPTIHDREPGRIQLSLTEGAEAELQLTVGDRTWPAGRVVGVPPDAPTSLELVVAVYAEGMEPVGLPFAARAVLRDDRDRPVYGAPVEWKVRGGKLALGESILVLPGPDYMEFADACIDPSDGSTRNMTLKASYRDLKDGVELEWSPAETREDEDWEPSEACVGGCSCRTGGHAPRNGLAALGGALALLALVGRRP